MDHTQTVKFLNRVPSPLVRLVFFSLLSLLLLFVDARYQYLESTRSTLSTLIYPLQRLAAMPPALWQQADDFLTTQTRLLRENNELREQHAQDAAQHLQLQSVQAENDYFRSLLEVQKRLNLPMRLTRVVYTERDLSRHRLFVDLGAQASIQTGQVVMSNEGVVGQITRVHPMLSEVTLITDKDHEVPVQILRTGLRSILFGSGDAAELDLRYIPANADVQAGDILVTSGIDGTYPAGLPAGKILRVEHDPAYPFARIQCAAISSVNNQHWLFVLPLLEKKLPPRSEDTSRSAPVKNKKAKREGP